MRRAGGCESEEGSSSEVKHAKNNWFQQQQQKTQRGGEGDVWEEGCLKGFERNSKRKSRFMVNQA